MGISELESVVEEARQAISDMKVRGAGEIARFAVKTLMRVSELSEAENPEAFMRDLNYASSRLLSSRPTAVSLPNGIRYVMLKAKHLLKKGADLDALKKAVCSAGMKFIDRSLEAVNLIARFGSKRIMNGDVVMTHCNSAAVTSILIEAHRLGRSFDVYVTETRPRYQGRITVRELLDVGIPCTLIVDSAMRHFMKDVDKVMVGADAVAANGALVNKVGTSLMALAAREARAEFLVAAETYKFSPETLTGQLVWIEERPTEEVLPEAERSGLWSAKVRNPSFDVTPPDYVDAIITELGVIPPQAAFWVLQKVYGSLSPEELASYSTIHPTE
ncbi:MAG: ribose 1,5-bisphosphate isomerase [Candidatus Bathyarchaeia archaeon]